MRQAASAVCSALLILIRNRRVPLVRFCLWSSSFVDVPLRSARSEMPAVCHRGGTRHQSDKVPLRAEELGNLIALIATCGPYTPRDEFRIHARIAAEYTGYSAREC
jgi:hypothetical protein